jgi:hypothetical protein
MKNNTNKLIFEELKKASLLFNYNPEKTLSENIQEQQGPVVYQDEDNSLNPAIVAKAEQMAAAGTSGGTTTTGSTVTSGGTTTGGTATTGSTVTSGNTSTSGTSAPTSVLITKNDNAYEYKMENGKYYFKGKAGTKFATKYPDWREAKAQKGIDAIKALFDKNPKGDTPSENSNAGTSGNTGTSGTAGTAGTNGTAGTSGTAGINNGIVDSDAQAQIQSTVSNDEEF